MNSSKSGNLAQSDDGIIMSSISVDNIIEHVVYGIENNGDDLNEETVRNSLVNFTDAYLADARRELDERMPELLAEIRNELRRTSSRSVDEILNSLADTEQHCHNCRFECPEDAPCIFSEIVYQLGRLAASDMAETPECIGRYNVSFPCRPGNKLFLVYPDAVEIHETYCRGIYYSVAWFIQTMHGVYPLDDFGSVVFTDRISAERVSRERRAERKASI